MLVILFAMWSYLQHTYTVNPFNFTVHLFCEFSDLAYKFVNFANINGTQSNENISDHRK